jgi:hypothetical protein
VSLLRDFNVVVSDREFEQDDYVIFFYVLSRDRPTGQQGELLTATGDVLQCLNRCEFVIAGLGLNRHHELLTVPVDANIDFVNFNLTHFRDCRTEMTLKRVRRDSEEDVDQSVVPDFG